MDVGLAGKVALVTGAGSGIGQAIAQTLAADGVHVIASDLKVETAEATINVVTGTGKCSALALDVTSYDAAQAGVKQIVDQYGQLDILVNCAGAWRINLFVDAPPEDWRFEVDVNLMGTIHMTRAALDPMINQSGGKIVCVASDAGRVGEFRQAVYSGAKGGIIAFAKAVAREVGRYNIHINTVCPGYTKTPGTDGMLDAELESRIAKGYPLRKLGLPDDVAKVVAFLASDGASHTTGQTISVSGGYTMV
ncbi:MAG: SDR family NAD(P)-dependent oxidoreductase [Pseudomonadota bacterium]